MTRAASEKRDRSCALIRMQSAHSRSVFSSASPWQMRQTCLLTVRRFRKLRAAVGTFVPPVKRWRKNVGNADAKHRLLSIRMPGEVLRRINLLHSEHSRTRQCGHVCGSTRRVTATFSFRNPLIQRGLSVRYVVAIPILVMLPVTICAAADTSKLPALGVDFTFEQKNKCQAFRRKSD